MDHEQQDTEPELDEPTPTRRLAYALVADDGNGTVTGVTALDVPADRFDELERRYDAAHADARHRKIGEADELPQVGAQLAHR